LTFRFSLFYPARFRILSIASAITTLPH
jgi:hypothetical protein